MTTLALPTESYLRKISFSAAPSASEEGLRLLHRAQAFSIPFENVEPFLLRPVSLDPAALAEKLLHRGRGGYCFELNALFLQAMRAFGFSARPVLGRVFMGRPEAGPRTHQASLVEVGGRTWLADVGFGGPGLVDPIPFEPGYEGEQQGRRIRLRKDPAWGMVYEDEFEGSWRTIYALPEEKALPVDFTLGNHYCATHPESIFTKSLYCALPGEEGRVTIYDRSVHVFRGGKKEEHVLQSEGDLTHWLQGILRLNLNEADIRAVAQKLFA